MLADLSVTNHVLEN